MENDRSQDRDGMEPETFHEDGAGDPVAAFEALRETIEDLAADLGREMTTIRKGVESAFDQFERQGAPVDYSAELGRMTQQLVTELDHETSYRRRLEEMASEQRVMLIEQGVPRGELPTWPKRTTPTEGDI